MKLVSKMNHWSGSFVAAGEGLSGVVGTQRIHTGFHNFPTALANVMAATPAGPPQVFAPTVPGGSLPSSEE